MVAPNQFGMNWRMTTRGCSKWVRLEMARDRAVGW